MSNPSISDLQRHLMETLADLRDRKNPMDVDRARAVAQVGGVLVDSAKVIVDYIKATGQDSSEFLGGAADMPRLTTREGPAGSGITAVTRHRLQG